VNLSTALRRPAGPANLRNVALASRLARPALAAELLIILTIAAGLRARELDQSFEHIAAAGAGVATVFLVYELGRLLYGRGAALLAALLMAVMPYHAVFTQQALLNGAMTLSATLTLVLLAQFVMSGRREWLYAVGATMGVTILVQETSIVLLAAIYAFSALTPELRVGPRDLALSIGVMALVIAPFALTTTASLDWLLLRDSDQDLLFYLATVPEAIGFPVLLAALLALWLFRAEASWRETLLLCWIVVPIVCLQLLPVKGFHYLLPIAPPLAVLAGRTLSGWWSTLGAADRGRGIAFRWFGLFVAAVVATSLLVPTWERAGAAADQRSREVRGEVGRGEPPSATESARMNVEVRDALLGFPIGSAVSLEYPNGRVETYPIGRSAELTVGSLPRGNYRVSVEALGISSSRPVALWGDRRVGLEVMSWLDLAIVALGLGSIALALLYVRRRRALTSHIRRTTFA
jgi:Dolichyl-phosphate-mannose-protein mannosyltransferase